MPPPGIEPGLQVPETCVISFSPRGREDAASTTLNQGGQLKVREMVRPSRAVALAAAKINLCLRIRGVRPDGYHLLDGIVVPIGLFDRLDIVMGPARELRVRVDCGSSSLRGDESNLVVKAARLFLERTGVRADVAVGLRKEIPMGSGLGGGSSDAAATLVALNRLTGDEVDRDTLLRWGADLGADLPFFVVGRPARVQGIGEQITTLAWRGSLSVVVAFPGAGLSTAAVYAAYDRSLTTTREDSNLLAFLRGQVPLQAVLTNDLEAVASQMYPPVRAVKERLLELGACGAAMTGSGSATFGLWEERDRAKAAAERLRLEDGIWARAVDILDRVPEIMQENHAAR
jgi:4-diphosphocytidyl-2-C-methyl-D-erythritol kinase